MPDAPTTFSVTFCRSCFGLHSDLAVCDRHRDPDFRRPRPAASATVASKHSTALSKPSPPSASPPISLQPWPPEGRGCHRTRSGAGPSPARSVRPQSTACPLVLPPEHPRGRHSRFPGPCIPSSSVNQSIPHVQSSLLPVLRSQPSGVYTTSGGPCQNIRSHGSAPKSTPPKLFHFAVKLLWATPSESIPMSFLLPAGTWWPGLAAPLGCGTFPSSGQHIRPGLGCYFTLVVRPRYAESRSLLVLPQDGWALLQAGRIPTCLGGSKSLEASAQMPPSHVSGFPVFPAWPLTLA